jgi:hypothetical protein
MDCQFEEKEFEQPLNAELACKGRIFPPGQVLEGIIGIDAAVFSTKKNFFLLWKKDGSQNDQKGVHLNSKLWDFVAKQLDDTRFPKFKCNVFLQHKCPTYIKKKWGGEYRYWNQPYFRYELKENQQDILSRLDQKVSSHAIVAYSCPSFWESEELWRHAAESELVENTNFARPREIDGHALYTFVKGGAFGKAFSEHPVTVKCVNIIKEIDNFTQKEPPFDTNTGFIYSLSRSIGDVLEKSNEVFRRSFFKILESLALPEQALIRNLAKISIFTYMADISWDIFY